MAAPSIHWVYLFTGAIIKKCHRLGSLLSCSSRGWIHSPDPSLILKQIIVPDARSAAKTQPPAVRFFQESLAGKVSFPRIIFSSQSSSCPKNDQNDALKAQPPPSTWLTLKTHPCIKHMWGPLSSAATASHIKLSLCPVLLLFLPQVWFQEYFLIRVLHINLYHWVCFLDNPACDPSESESWLHWRNTSRGKSD